MNEINVHAARFTIDISEWENFLYQKITLGFRSRSEVVGMRKGRRERKWKANVTRLLGTRRR